MRSEEASDHFYRNGGKNPFLLSLYIWSLKLYIQPYKLTPFYLKQTGNCIFSMPCIPARLQLPVCYLFTECCQSNHDTAYYCDYQLHNGMQRREKDHSSAMKEKNEFNGQRIVCNNEGHSLQRRTLDDHVEYPSFRLSKRCQLPTP